MRSSPRRLLPRRRSPLPTTFIATEGVGAQEAEGREDSRETTDLQALKAVKGLKGLKDHKDRRQLKIR